jgi:hypothetical protein
MKNTTKNLLAVTFTVWALFAGSYANAQSADKSKLRFGIGLDALLPVGNFTNTANFGLGITPRLQYGIADNLALTFTSGIYHYFTKKLYVTSGLGAGSTMENALDVVPVKFGIKAFVSSNIYLGAEVGAGFEVDNGGGSTKLIASPAIGYACKKLDVGLRYENFSGQGYHYGIVGLRLAYGFGL